MARRKGGSTAGKGLLVVLGLAFVALDAVYRIIVENVAATAVFGLFAGVLLILWYAFSKLEGRKTTVVGRVVVDQRSQVQLPSQRGYVEPRVYFGFPTK